MGLSLSILLSAWNEILGYNIFDFIAATRGGRSIRMTLRSSSFKKQDSETTNNLERSLSFKELVTMKADLTVKNKNPIEKVHPITKLKKPTISLTHQPVVFFSPRPKTELDAAATKVQKVYKSYRTRRNLADCAVVAEELWWKTLDSVDLRRYSISFFDIEKKETAVSRWSRAKRRLAKVGKGLSKDEKAQKLALQHWLEAIDPRHRYGHNLHFYYDIWSESKSTQPFFYWLDVGDGKEISHEKCTRTDLQHQCIKYLGPKEREEYEVIVEHGKLAYRQTGMSLNTSEGSKWIFVLSTTRSLYVGQKKKGTFQHSSFLSGAAITAAGRLVAHDGVLEAIWPYSGHYLPTEDNFNEFISFLEQQNVDLTNVKRCAIDDDDALSKIGRKDSIPEEAKDLRESNKSNNPMTIPVNGPSNTAANMLQAVMVDTLRKPPAFDGSKRLSCKWTSGVGPRIGCVRDYPLELQSQALEQVHLSPKVNPGRVISPFPIPSPRPSPKIRVSPRLAYMGLPSPRIQVTTA